MKIILGPTSQGHSSIGVTYRGLDGLRGIAILAIIQYHVFSFPVLSEFTWIGVDLFFVLSGFLITGILLRARESPHFFRNFYMRRVLRIMPIYYLSFFLLIFLCPRLFYYPVSLGYFLNHQAWFWFEIQNWLFIFKPEGNNNFLNHFWSLGLEEQFYLISPWIIFFIKDIQKILGFLLFLIFLLTVLRISAWRMQFENFSYKNLFSFTRIDGLCAGSFLAVIRHDPSFAMSLANKRFAILLGVFILLALPVCKLLSPHSIPALACCVYPAIAALGGIVVAAATRSENHKFSILTHPALLFFGRISYGLYIFHWPVYILVSGGRPVPLGQLGFDSTELLRSIVSTAISIVLATLSYIGFEQYFLRLKKYFP